MAVKSAAGIVMVSVTFVIIGLPTIVFKEIVLATVPTVAPPCLKLPGVDVVETDRGPGHEVNVYCRVVVTLCIGSCPLMVTVEGEDTKAAKEKFE